MAKQWLWRTRDGRHSASELDIRGWNLEINYQIRRHVEKKLGRFGRQLPGLSRTVVKLSSDSNRRRRDRFLAQVTLYVGGSILLSEQRASDQWTAVNWAAEVLSHRIKLYKSRAYRSERARHNRFFGRTRHVYSNGQTCCLLYWCRPKQWRRSKLWLRVWPWSRDIWYGPNDLRWST